MIHHEVQLALRASNAVAIVMLFASGYMLARYGGYRPILTGASMVVLGVALVDRSLSSRSAAAEAVADVDHPVCEVLGAAELLAATAFPDSRRRRGG